MPCAGDNGHTGIGRALATSQPITIQSPGPVEVQ